ncbi:MAG: class II aldolase/adducin family protein [Methylococcales bacterium]
MNEIEGVIKFKLDYTNTPLPEQIVNDCRDTLSTLNVWRNILKQLGMIGQDPLRYNGLGFGNMSIRTETNHAAFLITGTQTGKLNDLQQHHFSLVTAANTENNSIVASGKIRPSSEALTHASIYSADQSIQVIIHIHFPLIWQLTRQLNFSATASNVAYGTPQMALAVINLVKSIQTDQPAVFAMLGHEDGVVAYGDTVEGVAQTLIGLLARALKYKNASV